MTTKKNAARTALISALFTALLVPSAFAGEGMPIDLQTAIAKAFASHADIKKAEYSLDAARANSYFWPWRILARTTYYKRWYDNRL